MRSGNGGENLPWEPDSKRILGNLLPWDPMEKVGREKETY